MPRRREDTSEVPQYMREVRKDVDRRLTDLKSDVDDIRRVARKTLKEQPLLALGVAFVVGMAIGIAIASAGD